MLASPHEFLLDEPVSRVLSSRAYFRRPAGCWHLAFCSVLQPNDSRVHDSLMNDSRFSLHPQPLADFPLASLPHGFRTGPLRAPLSATLPGLYKVLRRLWRQLRFFR